LKDAEVMSKIKKIHLKAISYEGEKALRKFENAKKEEERATNNVSKIFRILRKNFSYTEPPDCKNN
jgi:hypothetical protein